MIAIAQHRDGTTTIFPLAKNYDAGKIEEWLESGKLAGYWTFETVQEAYDFHRDTFSPKR